mgnify:CR=1 FL=1|jgi:uncharacterized protein YuzE
MGKKNLKEKGEMDYDYANDILFFKVKDRDYNHSIELDDLVLDANKDGDITGLQIFGASKMFDIDKDTLRNITKWEFKVRIEGKIISIQLIFEMLRRNQVVERGQNLIRESSSSLTDSEVMCTASI